MDCTNGLQLQKAIKVDTRSRIKMAIWFDGSSLEGIQQIAVRQWAVVYRLGYGWLGATLRDVDKSCLPFGRTPSFLTPSVTKT